jgi:CRISPR-associated protein Cmr6
MTDEKTAKHLTQILWGGIDGAATLGQLGISFTYHDDDLKFDKHHYTPPGKSEQIMPLYNLKRGTLQISCMNRRTSSEDRQELAELAKAIVQFSLLLGGFGKSWRRADHRLFFRPYLEKGNKPMIGCHWKFIDSSESLYLPITDLQQDLSQFIDRLRTLFQNYAAKQGYTIHPDNPVHCDWREAWYPYDNQGGVQVWGRIVEDRIKAIKWFHQPYEGTHTLRNLQGSIGQDSQTGRLWHRIYPYYHLNSEGKLQRQKPPIELLTFFPETTEGSTHFIAFLNERSDFVKIW